MWQQICTTNAKNISKVLDSYILSLIQFRVDIDSQNTDKLYHLFELLLLFARNKNIALFRETLYENVWGSDFMGDSRTVDLHVQRLRKKLHWEDKIKAIYKVGYRLEV